MSKFNDLLKTVDMLNMQELTAYDFQLKLQRIELDALIQQVDMAIYVKLKEEGLITKDLTQYIGKDLNGMKAFTEDGAILNVDLDEFVVWVDEDGRMRAEDIDGSMEYNHNLKTYMHTSKHGSVDLGDLSFLNLPE